jgi:hypothetical protein
VEARLVLGRVADVLGARAAAVGDVVAHGQLAGVAAAWKESVGYGTLNDGPRLDPALMFDDVFKDLPQHLARQRDELATERARIEALRAAYGLGEG